MAFYPEGAPVPRERRSERVWLRPLRAADAELDHEAVMASQALLRGWSQSGWPADGFTVAANRGDLLRHEREHDERKAFTFTVLDPPGTRCLGCVYLEPVKAEEAAVCPGAAHPVHVGFWVRASELAEDLDRHLLETLRDWLRAEWAFDAVVFTIGNGDSRQAALLAEAGLEQRATFVRPDGRACRAFA